MVRHLALVIHSLSGGGSERILVALANHWAEQGHDVTLITLDSGDEDAYQVVTSVQRVELGLMHPARTSLHALWNNSWRILKLRQAIRRSGASTVISFCDKMNVLTLLASTRLGLEVVISERADPRRRAIGRIWSALRRLTYPHSAALVVQSESVARWSRSLFEYLPLHVIPNAVEPCQYHKIYSSSPTDASPAVLGMGRLVPQKGFDLLLRAFSRLKEKHPRWSLRILGEGPSQSQLEQLIEEFQLESRVKLLGRVSRPQLFLREADLFVLSSRYEGFPNALLEAMACGLPVISFACPSGPDEIIRHDLDGLLVSTGDVSALAKAMDQLMGDTTHRERLGRRAVEVVDRFSTKRCMAAWENVWRDEAER